ncbi:helix-turn-helix transcriptional regulator [Pseudonocardia benzenivorans]
MMRGLNTTSRQGAGAPRFYSVAEVAEIFGMSPMTVYRAIAAGSSPRCGSAAG